ncbi:MAG TPA: GNAT family protein [Solirubrobacteraceae bacterium]|jgi:RimJ/RimL family protein N-acetyltransferase
MRCLPERVEGEELLLRRWRAGDAAIQARAVAESAEHLRPWMPWMASEPLSPGLRRAMLVRWEQEWLDGGDVMLGAWIAGEVVGGCGFHRRRGPQTLEIGYWVHASFLRAGIATSMARLLTATAFTLPGITRVEIRHDRANIASAGIPRQLGYVLAGETAKPASAPAETGVECIWRTEPKLWAPQSDRPRG